MQMQMEKCKWKFTNKSEISRFIKISEVRIKSKINTQINVKIQQSVKALITYWAKATTTTTILVSQTNNGKR